MRLKKIIPIILPFIMINFLLPLSGQETRYSLVGHSASPRIDDSNRLSLLYASRDRGLNLASALPDGDSFSIQTIAPGEKASASSLKTDRKGRSWIVWESEAGEMIRIYATPLGVPLTETPVCLSTGYEGFNHSPDLAFDLRNQLWAAWIHYSEGHHYLLVRNAATSQTWVVNRGHSQGAFSPRILVDGWNRIWVFWVGAERGPDKILFSRHQEDRWTPPEDLDPEDPAPHLYPDAVLDREGTPWITWCAFDGHDYEIAAACWTESGWRRKAITINQTTDVQPSLAFTPGNSPVFVWCKTQQGRSGIYGRLQVEGSRYGEIPLADGITGPVSSPRMVVRDNLMGIAWQSGDLIQSKLMSWHQLAADQNPLPPAEEPQVPFNSELDENTYIGFGDSITFGYMDYEEAPDLGYIPRLKEIFDTQYGESEIINEGWPGEVTLNGLGRMEGVVNSHNARYLLLMEGTNDIIFHQFSMETTAYHLEQMLTICIEHGIFPVLTTIIPRNDYRWRRLYYQERIYELNDNIRALAEKMKISLVDQFNIYFNYPESEGGWPSLLSTDNVHPSIKGYEIMTDAWFREIKNLPFPTCSLDVRRVFDRILLYSQEGNHILWADSPKLLQSGEFTAYRIYRRESGDDPGSLELLISIPWEDPPSDPKRAFKTGEIGFRTERTKGFQYLDRNINHANEYEYAITLLRKDGIEGPCSSIASDTPQRR